MNAHTDARGAFISAQQQPRISGDLFDAFNRLRHLRNAYPDAALAVLEGHAFDAEDHDEILYQNVVYLRAFAPQLIEILEDRKEREVALLSIRQSLMDTNVVNSAPIRKMAGEIAALEQKPLIDVLGGLTLNDLREMLADPADIMPQAQTCERTQ